MEDNGCSKTGRVLQRKNVLNKDYSCKKCIYSYRCWQNDRGMICRDFIGQNNERMVYK